MVKGHLVRATAFLVATPINLPPPKLLITDFALMIVDQSFVGSTRTAGFLPTNFC
jgi:hypothetical protein